MQIEMDKLMELGSKLKEKRRALGLEREEIAIKIKVSAKTLHALEEAIADSLPQAVFARGFARSYATALGLDLAELAQLIDAAFPLDSSSNINPELSASAREQSISINQTSNTKFTLIVIPVLFIILGGAGWFIYKSFFSDIDTAPISQPARPQSRPAGLTTPPASTAGEANNAEGASTAEVTNNSAAPAASPEPVAPAAAEAPSPSPAADNAAASQPVSAPEQSRPAAAEESATLDLPPELVPQSNARADRPIPRGKNRIVLFAKYNCWIGAEFDGGKHRSFTLEAGKTFVLDFETKLTLTLGNSGGIEMSYNGEPYELGGRFNEARVLHFTRQ